MLGPTRAFVICRKYRYEITKTENKAIFKSVTVCLTYQFKSNCLLDVLNLIQIAITSFFHSFISVYISFYLSIFSISFLSANMVEFFSNTCYAHAKFVPVE